MWTFAKKENEVKEYRINRVYPLGIAVLLIKIGASLYAVASQCPHMACSLGGAVLEGTMLQCPCHDWTFDVTTGQLAEATEIRLTTYRSKTENGDIFIDL
jgi:nitrite reductase/ring-hydroxylating ferredoxin subunit